MNESEIRARLEYLRGELRAERISYGELAELEGLAEHIEPGDTELLQAAGVPEFEQEQDIIAPEARRVLDVLGNSGAIIEWRPEMSGGNVVVVVFNGEAAARITVESIPDPGAPEHEENQS